MLHEPLMKTLPRAPHFLRVTQALAFVSGVGTCLVGAGAMLAGCGNGLNGSAPSPDLDGAPVDGAPASDATGVLDGQSEGSADVAAEDAPVHVIVTGILVAPDAASD